MRTFAEKPKATQQVTSPKATVPPVVHEVLRSSGQPLDAVPRAFMESRFGYDFGSVRIHTDPRASESSQAVNAQAYTVGSHIVFGSAGYAPHTDSGRRLLAHELAHVVQHASAGAITASSGPQRIDEAGSALERSAESTAARVVHGTLPNAVLGRAPDAFTPALARAHEHGPLLQRQSKEKIPVIEVEIPKPPEKIERDPGLLERAPRLRPCMNEIVPVDCFGLENRGGPQLKNVNGVFEQYVFSCTDEVCDDDDAEVSDQSWIVVPDKSKYKCGDTVAICADDQRTSATVVDRRPEWKYYLSRGAAKLLGHSSRTPDGSPAKSFRGKVFADVDQAREFKCCPDKVLQEIEGEPGDWNLPDPKTRLA